MVSTGAIGQPPASYLEVRCHFFSPEGSEKKLLLIIIPNQRTYWLVRKYRIFLGNFGQYVMDIEIAGQI